MTEKIEGEITVKKIKFAKFGDKTRLGREGNKRTIWAGAFYWIGFEIVLLRWYGYYSRLKEQWIRREILVSKQSGKIRGGFHNLNGKIVKY